MPSDVVEVLSAAEIASALALAQGEMGETVFDRDTLTLSPAPLLRCCHATETLLQFLLRVDLQPACCIRVPLGGRCSADAAKSVVEGPTHGAGVQLS